MCYNKLGVIFYSNTTELLVAFWRREPLSLITDSLSARGKALFVFYAVLPLKYDREVVKTRKTEKFKRKQQEVTVWQTEISQ